MTHLNDLAQQCAITRDPERIKALIYDFTNDLLGIDLAVADAKSAEVLSCYVFFNLMLSQMRAQLDVMNEAELTTRGVSIGRIRRAA